MNLNKKFYQYKLMFFKKNIFLLILIFTFFFIINKKVSAIDPVEIGIKYQKDVEINLSVIENIKGLKTERISIDRDIRTKKKELKIENKLIDKIDKKESKKIEIKDKDKNVPDTNLYSRIKEQNIYNGNRIEILFNPNSANIKDLELQKIKNFLKEQKSKNTLFLKITSYAKASGDDDSRRVSLDRAINIRAKVIEMGISPENLVVKALGNFNKNIIKNKVDIEIIEKI